MGQIGELMKENEPKIVPAYLRLKEAAVYLSMSQPGLQRLHRLGKGPPRITKGRAVFYSIRALDAWMEQDIELPTGIAAA